MPNALTGILRALVAAPLLAIASLGVMLEKLDSVDHFNQ